MSNQTTPQASDLPLPLAFNGAAKEDACAGRWNACVECADGFSFCETFGFDKEEAESRARLVTQAVNERAELVATITQAEFVIRKHILRRYEETRSTEAAIEFLDVMKKLQALLSRAQHPAQPKDV